jgi:hypothetical protein
MVKEVLKFFYYHLVLLDSYRLIGMKEKFYFIDFQVRMKCIEEFHVRDLADRQR